jgi:ABC-type phosphate/phosphonate transport system substrate-binding protein
MARLVFPWRIVLFAAAGLTVAAAPAAHAQPNGTLHIGTSGSLASATSPSREAAAIDTLRDFIKSETGFTNEIVRQKDWRELADKMSGGRFQLGVFQGYEFARAQEKFPKLKPLAVAVNVFTYPTAYVVTRRDDPAADFAGLQGHTLALAAGGGGYVRLFVDRQAEAHGKKADAFFSKITEAENVEDALDDLVDGKVQAVAADRAALEAYKRRKPGRFNQLKAVAHSQPFAPTVVAYTEGALDAATLQRFRDGLLRASHTDRGQTLLTLFKITGFENVPADFDRVLGQTRKDYPPAGGSER